MSVEMLERLQGLLDWAKEKDCLRVTVEISDFEPVLELARAGMEANERDCSQCGNLSPDWCSKCH